MFETLTCTEVIIDTRSQLLDLRAQVFRIGMEGVKSSLGGPKLGSELLRVQLDRGELLSSPCESASQLSLGFKIAGEA
jgi:hypothetical protein